MRRRPIGYYVHHQGAGHRTRAEAILRAIDWPLVLLGTGIGDRGLDLPDDRPGSGRFDGLDDAPCRPDTLHYAPLDHGGIRERVARIASWIAAEEPAIMVVDVSVEVAMLARLASVPTICVRLNGKRDDAPHLEAFRGAIGLMAPFHPTFEMTDTPAWIRDKTVYFPGIAASAATSACLRERRATRRILVVIGRGGLPGDGKLLAQAAMACPDWEWRVIGPVAPATEQPANLKLAGWVETAEQEIADASIVVGAAGDGLVGAVIAADKPFICIPEGRPYDEQRVTAQGLSRLGAALVLPQWPCADQWAAILEQVGTLEPAARTALGDPHGTQMAAQWLARCAADATLQRETIA